MPKKKKKEGSTLTELIQKLLGKTPETAKAEEPPASPGTAQAPTMTKKQRKEALIKGMKKAFK